MNQGPSPRQLAVVEASFISALQQTYSVVGSNGALELPHDAFIPWEKDAPYNHSVRLMMKQAARIWFRVRTNTS